MWWSIGCCGVWEGRPLETPPFFSLVYIVLAIGRRRGGKTSVSSQNSQPSKVALLDCCKIHFIQVFLVILLREPTGCRRVASISSTSQWDPPSQSRSDNPGVTLAVGPSRSSLHANRANRPSKEQEGRFQSGKSRGKVSWKIQHEGLHRRKERPRSDHSHGEREGGPGDRGDGGDRLRDSEEAGAGRRARRYQLEKAGARKLALLRTPCRCCCLSRIPAPPHTPHTSPFSSPC